MLQAKTAEMWMTLWTAVIAIGTAVLAIPIVVRLVRRRRRPAKGSVFVSMPMLDLADHRYAELQRYIVDAVRELRRDYRVYFFNESMPGRTGFKESEFDGDAYIAELSKCENFIAVLPHKLVSSVHFEAGYALASGKNVMFFVSQESDVPLLVRKMAKSLPSVKLIVGLSDEDLLPQMKQTLRAFHSPKSRVRRSTV